MVVVINEEKRGPEEGDSRREEVALDGRGDGVGLVYVPKDKDKDKDKDKG